MTERPNHHKKGGSRLSVPEKKQTPASQKKKEKIIMVVMIILAVIMVLAATVAVLYARWVKKPVLPWAPGILSGPAASGAVEDPNGALEGSAYDSVQPKVSGERKSEDFYTILVFGEDESSGLTDNIMVVSYDVTNQQATVMSIPRDTLVNSSAKGIDSKKVNAVYKRNGGGEKGIEALKNEVSELVGFMPDYYVMINWELVGQMVDAIGGVWFDVPYDMNYKDPTQDLYIDLDKGYQQLNGDQAMQLVRWRKNNDGSNIAANGDVGRLEIQHDFLKAVLKQMLQLKNVTKISQLAALFGENVTSDLTIENLCWFGSQAIFNGLSVDDVNFITMPYGYGSYVYNGSNRSFVYPLQNKLLTLINESLNPFVESVTIRELDLISVASDGSLRSSTGVLADPSMSVPPPAAETDSDPEDDEPLDIDPEENGPVESGPPGSDPAVPDDPGNTDPSESDWPAAPEIPDPDPEESEPPAAPSQEVPADVPPEPFVPLD